MNQLLYDFASWLASFESSPAIHESLYLYPWIEATHVMTLTLFLGMLCFIDLRMLGWSMVSVPASKIAEKLDLPMMIGMAIMFVTGLLLFYAIPIRTTQSLPFRIKMILMLAAIINALLFRRRMLASVSTWDNDPKPPKHIRVGAALSLTFWAGVVITGRCIAYNWFDCDQDNSHLINVLAGCLVE